MLGLTDLRKGTFIQLNSVPYQVVDYQHTQLGRGGAIVRTKLKNLLNGAIIAKTFKGNDKAEAARLQRQNMQCLYKDKDSAHLMDLESYEQFSLSNSANAEQIKWLSEGDKVVGLKIGERLVGLELPAKLKLEVIKTEPGVRGDTTGSANKPATLASGANVQVPLFIKSGETILIDTRTGAYAGRA